MIGANRRGILAGSQEADKHLPQDMPVEEIQNIAQRVLTRMTQAGYAHLDPRNISFEALLSDIGSNS